MGKLFNIHYIKIEPGQEGYSKASSKILFEPPQPHQTTLTLRHVVRHCAVIFNGILGKPQEVQLTLQLITVKTFSSSHITTATTSAVLHPQESLGYAVEDIPYTVKHLL